ncbi:hypothetical protein [Chryseolinea serpens]|uniref:hypothetical protein n=1 Tax=Chryseolinea serpens TaxID=947013 RepID=UPI001160F979|nr:hypothetical protein [Chryseolinea serpens]
MEFKIVLDKKQQGCGFAVACCFVLGRSACGHSLAREADECTSLIGKKPHGACAFGFDSDAIGDEHVGVPGSDGLNVAVGKREIEERGRNLPARKNERVFCECYPPMPVSHNMEIPDLVITLRFLTVNDSRSLLSIAGTKTKKQSYHKDTHGFLQKTSSCFQF